MRLRPAILIAALLATAAVAQQQTDNQQPAAPQQQAQSQKKAAKAPPAQAKPEQPAAKPAEPAPAQPEPKATDDKDKKEETFDMTEVAPVVTHHQVTVDGKTF